MLIFTTGEVLELAKFTPATFDRWVKKWTEAGTVVPISGGEGTGNHRQWSLTQAVGWVVASEVWHSERGCVPVFVEKTVAAFSGVTDKWLEAKLDAGSRYYASHQSGRPMLQDEGKQYQWPDVQAIYDDLRKLKGLR